MNQMHATQWAARMMPMTATMMRSAFAAANSSNFFISRDRRSSRGSFASPTSVASDAETPPSSMKRSNGIVAARSKKKYVRR